MSNTVYGVTVSDGDGNSLLGLYWSKEAAREHLVNHVIKANKERETDYRALYGSDWLEEVRPYWFVRSNDDHYSSTIQDVFVTEHEVL